MSSNSPLLKGTTVGVCGGSRPLHIAARWLADLGAQAYAVDEFAPEPADLDWLGPLSPLPPGMRVDVLLTRAACSAPGISAGARVSVTGSGASAPEPRRELSEREACAVGGIAIAIGEPDRDPLPLPNGALDSLVGAHVAAAAVAALLDGRTETEVAAADVAAWLVATNIKMYEPYGARWNRDGRRASGCGGCYPYGLFEAKDGLFCLMGRGLDHWAALVEMVGDPALVSDERLRDPRVIARTDPAAADAVIAPWIAKHSRAQLIELMVAAKFPGGPVETCADVLALDSFSGRWRNFGNGAVKAPDLPFTLVEGAADTPQPKTLEGLRVLDLAWVWSGPAVSTALGDLGAHVVKVESANRPDNTRIRGASIVRPPRADAPPLEVTEYFQALNRGKQSVALDLKTDAGREILRRLADQADVIIENLSPGVMARWGISPEAVLETNPTCTFVSMRGFGEHAELRDLRAYAGVLSSAAGLEDLIRYDGEAPLGGMTVGFSDALAASHSLLLALAGVHSVTRHGHGAAISISQFEGAVSANGRNLIDTQRGGAVAPAPLSDRLDYVVAGEQIAQSPWVSSDLFTTVSPRWLEPVPVCSLPWRRGGAFPTVRGAAPELGADTSRVLRQWLDVDARDVEGLLAAGPSGWQGRSTAWRTWRERTAVDIHIEKNVKVRMRDGVALATDVYRPADTGRYPALLQRIPYNKEPSWLRDTSVDVLKMVQAGYAVVHQDTRGAGASEGRYRPFLDDRSDGVDTVAWAAAQPWCDGDVGMMGISYTAGTQWLAAIEAPAALKAIAPHSFHYDPYLGWLYQGGAFSLGFAIRWSLNYFSPSVNAKEEYVGSVNRYAELIWRLPTIDMPMLEGVAPFYFEWLEHPTHDEHWPQWSPYEHLEQVTVPALMTTGWYDAFVGGLGHMYTALKARGATPQARRPQLIIGPWSHSWWGSDFPERGYGEKADKEVFGLTDRTSRWFDHHIKGIDNGVDSDKPVRLFIMGANEWRDEDDWPLPDTRFTNYYLHCSGRANTAHGGGELSTQAPDDEREEVYLYDPLDPVPTIGGQTLLPPARMPANSGPRDQRALDDRADILFFTTPPLTSAVEVTGPVELVLFISSSAFDTDFTGKLVDVHPDGRAEILTDGILRVRYRDSFSQPSLMAPGEVYEIRIDLQATGNVFMAGHRIRLEVSSSSFPRWDRNTNTGNRIAADAESDVRVAVNRVFHDRDRASHLILPIIDRS